MTILDVMNLTRQFPNTREPAVNEVSLSMQNGEILALVGPSGCGKTTTLRLIAGLERPDSGMISLNGKVVASETQFIPPERRGIGMVFQDHALFPHLNVFENAAFGLRKQKPSVIKSTVNEMLRLVDMESLAKRYPYELSGGERQRVALVRALAPQPILLLLDEPFSSLDADLRVEIREQVRSLLKEIHATVIFVTHDQEEALFLGDRLAVFQRGCLEQIGLPEQIFHTPATRFVAAFMGASDFLPGQASSTGILTEIGILAQTVSIDDHSWVEIALRADDVDFQPLETGNAVILERIFRGAFNLYRLRLDSGQLLHAFKDHACIVPVGTRIQACFKAEHPLVVFHQGQVVGQN